MACLGVSQPAIQPPTEPISQPVTPATPASPIQPPSPAAQRAAALAKGLNLPHWFWLPVGGEKNFASPDFFTADDAKAIAAAGFTCVRIPIDPGRLFGGTAGFVNAGIVKKLDKALDILNDSGLVAVIDLHALGTQSEDLYDKQLHDDTKPTGKKAEENFIKNWTALAKHLSSRDPAKVVLELLNEPVFEKAPARWPAIQTKLLAAVRSEAPLHTVILTGGNWSSIDGLLALPDPLPSDSNVIYTFHFYEPHTFTHQGATWGPPNWALFKDLPYPSTPEALETPAAKIEDRVARAEALWYGRERWDAAKVAARLNRATIWAKQRNVVLWCGEFGVIAGAPGESRQRWTADVRTSLERAGIGWCVWDWAGNFGLTPTRRPETGPRILDHAMIAALGLTPKP